MKEVSLLLQRLTQALVGLLMLLLVVVAYFFIDQPLALAMHDLNLRHSFPVLVWITQLGRSVPYLVVLPVIALYYRYSNRSKQIELRLWFLWLTVLVTNALCFGLKIMIGRARPELLFTQHLYGLSGFNLSSLYHSFPSGHTTLVTTMVLSLSFLCAQYRNIFLILGVIIVATRIMLTYHYLSDVLLSFYLVVLEYRILLYIINRECPFYWARLGIK